MALDLLEELLAVGCLAGDLEPGFLEQPGEGFAEISESSARTTHGISA